jgi:hypothetical protein
MEMAAKGYASEKRLGNSALNKRVVGHLSHSACF